MGTSINRARGVDNTSIVNREDLSTLQALTDVPDKTRAIVNSGEMYEYDLTGDTWTLINLVASNLANRVNYWSGTSVQVDLNTDPAGGYPGDGIYIIEGDAGGTTISATLHYTSGELAGTLVYSDAVGGDLVYRCIISAAGFVYFREDDFVNDAMNDMNITNIWKIG